MATTDIMTMTEIWLLVRNPEILGEWLVDRGPRIDRYVRTRIGNQDSRRENVVSAIQEKILRKWPCFLGRTPNEWWAWVISITRDYIHRDARSNDKKPREEQFPKLGSPSWLPPARGYSPLVETENNEELEILEREIQQLEPSLRCIFLLRFDKDKPSFDEIGQKVDCCAKTASRRFRDAVRILRERMKTYDLGK